MSPLLCNLQHNYCVLRPLLSKCDMAGVFGHKHFLLSTGCGTSCQDICTFVAAYPLTSTAVGE